RVGGTHLLAVGAERRVRKLVAVGGRPGVRPGVGDLDRYLTVLIELHWDHRAGGREFVGSTVGGVSNHQDRGAIGGIVRRELLPPVAVAGGGAHRQAVVTGRVVGPPVDQAGGGLVQANVLPLGRAGRVRRAQRHPTGREGGP